MGRLKIEMLGTSFTIQANEDNQYLEKLLGYYQRITDDVKRIDSIKSPLQVAILSGIMICDELYKEKQNKKCSNIPSRLNNRSICGIIQK